MIENLKKLKAAKIETARQFDTIIAESRQMLGVDRNVEVKIDDGLYVIIDQQRAEIELNEQEAKDLRDWLNKLFPDNSK